MPTNFSPVRDAFLAAVLGGDQDVEQELLELSADISVQEVVSLRDLGTVELTDASYDLPRHSITLLSRISSSCSNGSST